MNDIPNLSTSRDVTLNLFLRISRGSADLSFPRIHHFLILLCYDLNNVYYKDTSVNNK